MADQSEFEHALKNYIAIILGYADLLLEEMPADDPRIDDMREIHKAATAAAALLNSARSSSA
jgi:signal transduction histidine kinase